MSYVRPLFLMIFWLFALSQFHNFLALNSIDVNELPSQNRQEFMIEPSRDWASQTNEKEELGDIVSTWESTSVGDWNDSAQTETPTSLQEEITRTIEAQENSQLDIQTSQSPVSQNIENSWFENEVVDENTIELIEPQAQLWGDSETESINTWAESLQIISNLTESSDATVPNPLPIEPQFDAQVESSVIPADDSLWIEPALSEDNALQNIEAIDTFSQTSVPTIASGDYYTCMDWSLNVEDSRDQRNIIKAYCEEVWWELLPDPNINYYLCQLNRKKEVGIEYIWRDLCE